LTLLRRRARLSFPFDAILYRNETEKTGTSWSGFCVFTLKSPALRLTMTLEEDEGIDLNPAPPASQAGSEKHSPAKAQRALIRCAEFAAAIPIILLLLPVYTLIRLCAAGVCICRMLRRKIHRHIPDMRSVIPDVCGASQNLKIR
jgi:hypothetical protein